ncbi:YceD family protein [Hoeflea sp. YIM 152468]|uniref:YceD family protein n=1 Tax=Hoeflea sp. YIM 152468 TaxID=3031759 RepID=UPI0023DA6D8C|nr:YceD family protein [Hoeflea sp. YIM 152468]MDF1607143.1 YceD family protein [Hoeflea sp. YIM 152468]
MTIPGDKAYGFPVKVSHVSANPFIVRISASAAELAQLAAQWGVPEVQTFAVEATLGRWKREGVRIKGHVSASIVQDCVVTLDPVSQQIEEDFETVFLPENSRLAARVMDGKGEIFLDPEGPDAPEMFEGDSIDVGAVAAEFAALAIDSYPRKPGLEFHDRIESDPTTDKKPSPFAVLQGLKRDDSDT